MQFLAMDLHISVITDVSDILERLGHSVDIKYMSGHAWVEGQKRARVRGLTYPTRSPRLNNILKKDFTFINEQMCDNFYKVNKNEFEKYDGFITSYPPAFALLFEKFNKPVILISCTRFDFPCIEKNRFLWLINGLNRMYQDKLLIPIANNKLDQEINEAYFDFEWKYIPSYCGYMKENYEPKNRDSILWHRGSNQIQQKIYSVNGINQDFSISNFYDRNQIRFYRAIIHMPYQVSIMSGFEHYKQNIPILFPSSDYLQKIMMEDKRVMSEILFNESAIRLPDNWVELSDFYNPDEFKFIEYFESTENLEIKLKELNFDKISSNMKRHNKYRELNILNTWSTILKEYG